MHPQFFCPVRTGEVVFMSSVVTRRHTPLRLIRITASGITHAPHSFSSSMEVKVSAYRQSLTDPIMSSLACQALLTMVAGTRHHPSFSIFL
jgi:acyl-CoA hydrolase